MRPHSSFISTLLAFCLVIPSADAAIRSIPRQNTPQKAIGSAEKSPTPTQQPNPNALGVFHAGPGVTPPRLIKSAEPEYTNAARRKKIMGTCIISLVVGVDGKPNNAKLIKSIAETVSPKLRSAAASLDKEALKTIMKYRFEPGTFGGKAVPVQIQVTMSFKITRY